MNLSANYTEPVNRIKQRILKVDNFENVDAADLNRLVDLEQEATAQVLRRWIRDS